MGELAHGMVSTKHKDKTRQVSKGWEHVPDGAPAPARALAAAPAALGAAQLVGVTQLRPARHQPGARV